MNKNIEKSKKERINMNIKDKSRRVTLNGIEFTWKFSIASLYELLSTFGYKDEVELMHMLRSGNIITLCEVFYSGILWEDNDKVSVEEFFAFLDISDAVNDIKFFIQENIGDFLDVKKKVKN